MSRSREAITFPVELSIKAVGARADDFGEHVLRIARRHADAARLEPGRARLSREGRYQAVTVRVSLADRTQMDALYDALGADARVRWAI